MLLGLQTLLGCRIENPGFVGSIEGSQERDDAGSSTQEEDDSSTAKASSTKKGKTSSTQSDSSASSSESTSSKSESTTSAEGATETSPVDVKDVCNKGAGYCFDMKVVQDDSLDNMAPTNGSTYLELSAIESGVSSTSPAFGHRLRLGSSSFVQTAPDIEIQANSNVGLDIWFTPDFSSTDSMMLARVGDLMSIEVFKDGRVKCQISATNSVLKTKKVYPGESQYTGPLTWRMVSCILQDGRLELWNSDAPVHIPPYDMFIATPQKVRVGVGDIAKQDLDNIVQGGFVGDLHLMRFWTNTDGYQETLRTELRELNLEPPN